MRMLTGLLALFLGCTPVAFAGDWVGEDGNPTAASQNVGNHQDLGIALEITSDRRWSRMAGLVTDGVPNYGPVTVGEGEMVLALLFMAGVEEDPALGRANITCTYTLVDPSNKVVMEPTKKPCLQSELPNTDGVVPDDLHPVFLTHEIMAFVIEGSDPKGVWTLKVHVQDTASKASIHVKNTFTVK